MDRLPSSTSEGLRHTNISLSSSNNGGPSPGGDAPLRTAAGAPMVHHPSLPGPGSSVHFVSQQGPSSVHGIVSNSSGVASQAQGTMSAGAAAAAAAARVGRPSPAVQRGVSMAHQMQRASPPVSSPHLSSHHSSQTFPSRSYATAGATSTGRPMHTPSPSAMASVVGTQARGVGGQVPQQHRWSVPNPLAGLDSPQPTRQQQQAAYRQQQVVPPASMQHQPHQHQNQTHAHQVPTHHQPQQMQQYEAQQRVQPQQHEQRSSPSLHSASPAHASMPHSQHNLYQHSLSQQPSSVAANAAMAAQHQQQQRHHHLERSHHMQEPQHQQHVSHQPQQHQHGARMSMQHPPAPQRQQPAAPQRQQPMPSPPGPTPKTPNPLTGGNGRPIMNAAPASAGRAAQQHHQQQYVQSQPVHHHHRPQQHGSAHAQHSVAVPHQSSSAPQQQPAAQRSGRRVMLTPSARAALTKAVISAINAPDGMVDEAVMNEAVAAGLPRNAVQNAANVARERERRKRAERAEALRKREAEQAAALVNRKSNGMTVTPSSHVRQSHRQQIMHSHQPQHPQQQQHPRSVPVQQQGRQAVHMAPPPAAAGTTGRYLAPRRTQELQRAPSQTPSALAPPPTNIRKMPPPPQQSSKRRTATSVPSHPQGYRASTSPATLARPPPSKPTASAAKSVTGKNSSMAHIQRLVDERARWKRVHSGVFMVHKGKSSALNGSLGAVSRCSDVKPTIRGEQSATVRSRAPRDWRARASKMQRQLRLAVLTNKQMDEPTPPSHEDRKRKAVASLLDPNLHKRYKLQPKKEGKALEKAVRKSRSAVSESLCRRHKEITKAIASHQFEFFKFHRLRKGDASRLARSVRDFVEKKEKRKERESDQAERARLAALRANDMEAYTALLEETKNERLKFLLGKTDECINQISSLLQTRSAEEDGDEEFASASEARLGTSYYSSAHIKMEEVRQPSILVGGDLKEYQIAGLQWLVSLYNNKLNGILADEMGLGKTIQTISLLAYLMEAKENLGPYLVIVPLSTLSNWVNEFAKWCPAARVVTYKGNPAQRKELYREEVSEGHFNVLLTTYEYIIKDKASLRKVMWQYAIVDEGHRMKNAQSKFAVILGTQYTTRHRILLTGTPLQNNLPELWALLNFLLPKIFNSVDTFDQWFNKPFAQFGSSGAGSASATASANGDGESDELLSNEERMLIIHRLHELLRPFMLRRVKSEVLDQLPEKVEKVLRCELSSWQKELYKQISASATSDKSLINGTGSDQPTRGLNNVVMQLRKVCNHPYLFCHDGYQINENVIRSSGKVELLDRMLPKLKAAGHRVLMFTQMTAAMTILEDYFAYRGYASLRLDGSTPAEERERRMYKFNAPDSPYFIFLLSTRAGGLGLNLATADTVIIFDSDWNPMMDLQAQDRAHRIGQRNDVRVFRLVTNSPVEEKILSRATEKLNMSELVVEAGKFDKSSVENDNSMERRRMMEVLLTDFDTSTTAATSDVAFAPADEDTSEQDGEEGEETNDTDVLNELLSSNEVDYQLYCDIDAQNASSVDEDDHGFSTHPKGLFTDPEDIPDWIRFPNGKKTPNPSETNGVDSAPAVEHSKRRGATKVVRYDDGMTEKQFVRLLEKEAQAEEDAAKARKRDRRSKQDHIDVGQNQDETSPALSEQTGSEQNHRISGSDTPSSKNSRKRKRKGISSEEVNPSDDLIGRNESRRGAKDAQSSQCPVSGEKVVAEADGQGKRRKGQPLADGTNRKLINTCKAIIALREPVTKRRLSEIFLDKPCAATYPDYYQLIERPIAINDILRKCRAKLYCRVGDFLDDWRLLFANARQYNADGSWVVVDAGTLEAELDRIMEKNGLVEEPPPPTPRPLRIKLSLKKIKDDDASGNSSSKKSNKSSKKNGASVRKRGKKGSDTESETSNDLDGSGSAQLSTNYGESDNVHDVSNLEASPYSDVVGMDERAGGEKKRGKSRNAGRSNRGAGGGIGSRGGKGAYRKNRRES